MRYVVPILVLGLTVGCGRPSPLDVATERPASAPTAGPSDDEAVLYTAALRDLLKDTPDGDGTYVWVGGRDPSADLMRRFQARWTKLRPATGMPADGYRINFTAIRRPGPARADVRAESYAGGSGSWLVFHLAEKGGGWEVAELSGEDVP